MKKTLIVTVNIVLSFLFLYGTASGQNSAKLVDAKSLNAFINYTNNPEVTAEESPAAMISTKVIGSFSRTFKGAFPKWYKMDNQYLARFTQDGKTTHALYKANGYMLYSVSKGSGRIMPSDVRNVIKSNYVDYEITSVTEVTSLGITAWIADLRLDNSLMIVKVIDGEIVETTSYRTTAK